MLKLLADENIPRGLVARLKKYNIDVIRIQDLGTRGIEDKELALLASRLKRTILKRTILTRDSDFVSPNLLFLSGSGVIFVSYQPSKEEISRLARRIVSLANQLEPRPGLLIIVKREHTEIYN